MLRTPTDKIIDRELTSFLRLKDLILITAAKLKTLDFNYFKGRIKNKTLDQILFGNINVAEVIPKLKKLSSVQSFHNNDILAMYCYHLCYKDDKFGDTLLATIKEVIKEDVSNHEKDLILQLYFPNGLTEKKLDRIREANTIDEIIFDD